LDYGRSGFDMVTCPLTSQQVFVDDSSVGNAVAGGLSPTVADGGSPSVHRLDIWIFTASPPRAITAVSGAWRLTV
jgi:hypothetical protein